VNVNAELVCSCQVYDRLDENDLTVELVYQEYAAVYSVADADQVFGSSARQYDALRRVIDVMWRRPVTASRMCVLHVGRMYTATTASTSTRLKLLTVLNCVKCPFSINLMHCTFTAMPS